VKIQLSTATLTCCATGCVVMLPAAMRDHLPLSVFFTHITMRWCSCQDVAGKLAF
jgi:hypothetical protein